MAGTFEVHGDGTITVAFAYTATADKITTTVGDAVHYLYPQTYAGPLEVEGEAPIPFDELTNQQKLNVLDAWLRKSVVDFALQYDRQRIRNEATTAANAADKYF